MNRVVLVGRLSRDPDVRYTNGGLTIAGFSLAVDRRFKKEGEQTADFIQCKAFGKTAEFVEKYFKKGLKVGVDGRIQTGSYQKDDGTKVYTQDVICESVEFMESKKAAGEEQSHKPSPDAQSDDFMNIPDGIDEELPFA